jgi:hypothetical protein
MKTNTNSITEELLKNGRAYAEKQLRETGKVSPGFIGITPDDRVLLSTDGLRDDEDKEKFATVARMLCVAHKMLGTVLVAEVWTAQKSSDEPADTLPSESINRREYVVISIETADRTFIQELLPIIRTDAGTFFGLGEAEVTLADSAEGRMTHFLPAAEPSEPERAIARMLLGRPRSSGNQSMEAGNL